MRRKVLSPGGLLRFNTICVCVRVYDNASVRGYLLWIATAVLDSCWRGRIQWGRLLSRCCWKHAPASRTQTIIGTVYRTHSGAPHNYRVQRLHLRIYANYFWSPSRTAWVVDGNQCLSTFKFVHVCVLLVIIGWRCEDHCFFSPGTYSSSDRK